MLHGDISQGFAKGHGVRMQLSTKRSRVSHGR
jgi:hypothetical protein